MTEWTGTSPTVCRPWPVSVSPWISSWAVTRNPDRSSLPESRTRVPGRRRSASHAWLNHTALATPDGSATVASTIRRFRRRVGRTRAERTSARIVASSPIRSSPIRNTFVRSR